MKLTVHLHLVLNVKREGTYTYIPCMPSRYDSYNFASLDMFNNNYYLSWKILLYLFANEIFHRK